MSYSQSTAVTSTPSEKRAGSPIGISWNGARKHSKSGNCCIQTWGQPLLHFRRTSWLVIFQGSESFCKIGYRRTGRVSISWQSENWLGFWAESLQSQPRCATLMLHPSPAVLRQAGHLFLLLTATHLTVNTSHRSHHPSAFGDTQGYITSAANAVHTARASNFTFIPLRRCAW